MLKALLGKGKHHRQAEQTGVRYLARESELKTAQMSGPRGSKHKVWFE